MRRPAYLFAALVLAAPGIAQVVDADEAPVRWVDGRPMLRATLRAGEKLYFCHLLLDLTTKDALFLHRNAAGSLRASSCDVEIGGIVLRDVPFTAQRDTWLERLTADHAEALQQVPVAGIVGLSAFGAYDLVLDGPGARLRRKTEALDEAPPSSEVLSVVPIAGDPVRDGVRIALDLGEGLTARVALHTREPFSWIDPDLAARAGHRDGVLATARAGAHLDFARWAPFRPERQPAGGQGGIGGAVLQAMTTTIEAKAGRVLFAHPKPRPYPEDEAAFYAARYGDGGTDALRAFLAAHERSGFAAEAARVLLQRALEAGEPGADLLRDAGLAAVRTAPADGKGTAALRALQELPAGEEFDEVRHAIASFALGAARDDANGNAVHELRLVLGQVALRAGDMQDARRHLLSAVFGMPISGPANLALGSWHEMRGEYEHACGRYLLALLAKDTGQEGFVALQRAHRAVHGDADFLPWLQEQTDGRVPSFHPMPRDPEAAAPKTGRTVLVELFTGAMCPPCAGADVAFDALGSYFDADEVVLVQWHLPVPAPEPLVAPVSLTRARARGIRGTPAVVVAGGEALSGGGRPDAAPELFGSYRAAVEAALAQAPLASVGGRARRAAGKVEAAVWGKGTGARDDLRLHAILVEDLVVFPGSNGILFHHHVARAQLTPPGGVRLAGVDESAPVRVSADLDAVRRDLDALVSGYEERGPFLVRPVAPDPARLAVVVFVEAGRSVLQAARIEVEAGE